jgi:hypothetical protein
VLTQLLLLPLAQLPAVLLAAAASATRGITPAAAAAEVEVLVLKYAAAAAAVAGPLVAGRLLLQLQQAKGHFVAAPVLHLVVVWKQLAAAGQQVLKALLLLLLAQVLL